MSRIIYWVSPRLTRLYSRWSTMLCMYHPPLYVFPVVIIISYNDLILLLWQNTLDVAINRPESSSLALFHQHLRSSCARQWTWMWWWRYYLQSSLLERWLNSLNTSLQSRLQLGSTTLHTWSNVWETSVPSWTPFRSLLRETLLEARDEEEERRSGGGACYGDEDALGASEWAALWYHCAWFGGFGEEIDWFVYGFGDEWSDLRWTCVM